MPHPSAPARPDAGLVEAAGGELSAALLAAEEQRLAAYIGPLARLLVRRAARDASDRQDFYARLGASTANGADRAASRATADD